MEVGLWRVAEDGFVDPVSIDDGTIARAALVLRDHLPPDAIGEEDLMRVAELVLRAALRC